MKKSWGVIAAVVLMAVAATLTAGASPATSGSRTPDPTRRGPLAISTIDYDAQVELVRAPTHAYPERLRGRIHVASEANGPFPVIVLVPGRHESCRVAGSDFSAGPVLLGPCPDAPPAIEDHPSWRGFDYLGRNLASNGYLVVTITTNNVNVLGAANGTEERTQLIARTLQLLEEWDRGPRTPPDQVGAALLGKVDLSRIGLMGHSRGADAVANFLREETLSGQDRAWPGLKAIFQVQGVDIAGQSDAPAGAHVGVLVGSCDADTGSSNVAPWERGRFLDASRRYARVLFHVVGANHNFFNSEWYDEWDPPVTQPLPLNEYSGNKYCSAAQRTNVRLAREDQERVGLALVGAFMRRYVGGETQFQPLMDGTATLSRGACPTGAYGKGKPLPCDEIVRTSYLAPERDRLLLLEPRHSPSGPHVRGRGFEKLSTCSGRGRCPQRTSASVADQLVVSWKGPATLELPIGKALDASRFDALTLRTMMNPSDRLNDGFSTQDFTVTLTDSDGRSASVRAAQYCCALRRPLRDAGTRLQQTPDPESDGYGSLHLNGLRIPLSHFRGVDLESTTSIELGFGRATRSGSIQLAEVAFQRQTALQRGVAHQR